ncbi:MAG: flagellar hook-basal body complex protein FliE [Rhodobacteraceae bacterium]|nr:flagellar hook-basal body complex protein FliE [Paracoccaceae bacterium]MCF8515696.1 flagellar hook-basal body complex protein FliE [Paracoccaceae bacterium]MCF8519941.1 flagellar hook-basal body complex protein FliE [Paracoccaceae bacterium]
MDIKKSLAAQAYAQTRSAAPPSGLPNSAEEGAARFLGSFAETLTRGEETARSAMTGGADPHALVEALASSQTAVETVVTVRDRVVEAYQEILRMPV